MKHPVESIVWKDPNELRANDYNPNTVIEKEMKLLEFSIRKNGWLHAAIITQDDVIIDGFHRHLIAKRNGWKIPCMVLNMSEPERIMLTVRINRAKGSHVAIKMADLVKELVNEHGVSPQQICEGIGCDKSEVELLLMDGIFEKHDIPNHQYSKAWYPK